MDEGSAQSEKKGRERNGQLYRFQNIKSQLVPSPENFFPILINSSVSIDVFYRHHQAVFTFVYFDIRMLMNNM